MLMNSTSSPRASSRAGRRRGLWSLIVDLISATLIVISLAFTVIYVVAAFETVVPVMKADWHTIGACVAALLLYGLAHALRAVRLYLILGVGQIRFTTLFGYQVFIALCSLATPFKVGDGVRALELYRLNGNDLRGILAVWIDRLFDVAIIVVILLLFLWSGRTSGAVHLVLMMSGLFLFGSIAAVLILPGGVASLARSLVVLRGERRFVLVLLGLCRRFLDLIRRVPTFDRATFSLLSIITLAIWAFECMTIFFALIALPVADSGAIAYAVQILGYAISGPVTNIEAPAALYRLVAFAALAMLSAGAFMSYARARIKTMSYSLPKGGIHRYRSPLSRQRVYLKVRRR